MQKIIDDILFQAECGRMMGAKSSRACIPASLHPWVLQELVKLHVTCVFESIDNSPVYQEPQYIYQVTLPNESLA